MSFVAAYLRYCDCVLMLSVFIHRGSVAMRASIVDSDIVRVRTIAVDTNGMIV